MAKRDYYDVLGIIKSTSPEEIKKAYRKQALKYHPDKNKGDKTAENKFKEASEAYHVLSDKERRTNYDQFGHAAFEGGPGRGGFGNFDFSEFSTSFSTDGEFSSSGILVAESSIFDSSVSSEVLSFPKFLLSLASSDESEKFSSMIITFLDSKSKF